MSAVELLPSVTIEGAEWQGVIVAGGLKLFRNRERVKGKAYPAGVIKYIAALEPEPRPHD